MIVWQDHLIFTNKAVKPSCWSALWGVDLLHQLLLPVPPLNKEFGQKPQGEKLDTDNNEEYPQEEEGAVADRHAREPVDGQVDGYDQTGK